jgi:hypothetical protein
MGPAGPGAEAPHEAPPKQIGTGGMTASRSPGQMGVLEEPGAVEWLPLAGGPAELSRRENASRCRRRPVDSPVSRKSPKYRPRSQSSHCSALSCLH